jgi:mRNA-degrading endonuclease toxin of MazEF toxin-antitoxin module
LLWAEAPGHVRLSAHSANLPKTLWQRLPKSWALDKTLFTERVGKLSKAKIELILAGIDVVLGR